VGARVATLVYKINPEKQAGKWHFENVRKASRKKSASPNS
jgi:hypothetical protein